MGLEVFNPFAGLLGEKQQQDSWRWGTVGATDPLRVQLDGDSKPLTIPPDTLVPVLTGDRVRVHVHNRRATIIGRAGGPALAYPAPNIVTIGGTDYPLSGSVPCPPFSWNGQTSTTADNAVFYGSIAAPIPYSPPAGYTFQWAVGESTRWVFVENADRYPSGGTQRVRVIQIASSATDGLSRLNWRLVKL